MKHAAQFKPRPLTKSRFKTGLECPRKLHYGGIKQYANQQLADPFLESLAEGGFQVGELAKAYYPGGHDIKTLDYDQALTETNELLQQENVVIFEAAVRYRDLFIRIDVLEKVGAKFYLHEVKAKSIGEEGVSDFVTRKGQPTSSWKPYLYDVAFQKYVLEKAFPDSTVRSYLMLVDKTATPSTSGLNQKIQLVEVDGRKDAAIVAPLNETELSEKLLVSINVDAICQDIYTSLEHTLNKSESFDQLVERLAGHSLGHSHAPPTIQPSCGKCEFHCSKADAQNGLLDGRAECIEMMYQIPATEVNDTPLIFELWNYRRKQELIESGAIRLADVQEDDISPDPYEEGVGLTSKQRQWLQVEKHHQRDNSAWIDSSGLQQALSSWQFPLNFIDFETTRVALPFHENQSPYAAVAFQFSHHVLHEDGRLEHRSQYLNATPGEFPNIGFIRELRSALEENNGTIFCYSHHENSILNAIKEQIESDYQHCADAGELISFIESIARPKNDSKDTWDSSRPMVDLLEIVKRYLYLPSTRGSNSIKFVLPAVLGDSASLQARYSSKIYSDERVATSLNFSPDWRWLNKADEADGGLDPYKSLPPIFDGYGEEIDERLSNFVALDNGGAALTAYAKLQFEDISDDERALIEAALLKYCELDTIAMVILYEYIKEVVAAC